MSSMISAIIEKVFAYVSNTHEQRQGEKEELILQGLALCSMIGETGSLPQLFHTKIGLTVAGIIVSFVSLSCSLLLCTYNTYSHRIYLIISHVAFVQFSFLITAPNMRLNNYTTAYNFCAGTDKFVKTPKTDFFGESQCNRLRTAAKQTPLMEDLTPKCSLKLPRRKLLQFSLAVLTPFLPRPTYAKAGLHLFPLQEPLENTYYLMRACETNSDASHIINSNPVNKLSLAMHSLTPVGVNQAMVASEALSKAGLTADAWIWPSVTISAFETAEILASRLQIRRENLVPEFAFLDARGVGALDGESEDVVRRVLTENDGRDSNWRPIPGEDGTPNDSTEDVFIRVRQLLSKLETQYSGENIVVISPDSDPLSILQATLVGEDLTKHHLFEFVPGEVRRVRELVTDMFGKVVEQPETVVVCRPRGRAGSLSKQRALKNIEESVFHPSSDHKALVESLSWTKQSRKQPLAQGLGERRHRRPWRHASINADSCPPREMDKGAASGDEGGEEENEKWGGPTANERVWTCCSAFIATIFVIVGELLSEQDLWGVVIIGGGLVALNVLITASSLEKINFMEEAFAEDFREGDDWTFREDLSNRQRAFDMTSIDMEELPSQDEGHTSLEYSDDEAERISFLHRLLHQRDSYQPNRHFADPEEEIQARRVVRRQKRTRTYRSEEDDGTEPRKAGRGRNVEALDHKRRLYKARRERFDTMERKDRSRERDKRERRSRNTKQKKPKRVRIAAGPTEDVVIGEV